MVVKEIDASLTYDLRHRLLRPNQNFEASHYPMDFDSGNFHLGVYIEDKLICVGSFFKENHPDLDQKIQFRLRGMATEPAFQGKGAGSMLIQFAETILQKKKASIWWCNARVSAAGYYEKIGLDQLGDIFEIVPIGMHKVMMKEVG